MTINIDEDFQNADWTKHKSKGGNEMIKAYKLHENDEHKAVVMLLLKAREIGRKAANDQLTKLQRQGSKWAIVDDNSNKVVGQMLDCCGFAWIKIPGRGKIVKAFKKLAEHKDFQDGYILEKEKMSISKAYNRGYNLNLGLNIGRQEMSVNEEAAYTASEFLNSAGLECRCESRID